MAVLIQVSLVILFAYTSWLLVKRGSASLMWFGAVNRTTGPKKFWCVVGFMAAMSVANALLVIAKIS